MEKGRKEVYEKRLPEARQGKGFGRKVSAEEMNRMPGKEEKSKRTGSSKIFSLGRGLYQAVLYPETVHARDAAGNWKEIDNTLLCGEDARGEYLKNKQNPAMGLTLRSGGEGEMVRLENGAGQSVSWRVEKARDVRPAAVPCPCPAHGEDDRRRAVLDHLAGEAVYEELLPGMDLKCRVQSVSFKDEWILKRLEAAVPLTIRLSAPGLRPQLLENGEIHLTAANGETPFIFPRPFMKDSGAAGKVGTVSVSLSPADGQDTWLLTYTPDAAWLANAQFPVTLDPAVITRKHSSALEDNYVTSKYPSTVQDYAYEVMRVSQGSGTWGTSKTFLRFLDSGLPKIDASYYITKAYLCVQTAQSGLYGLSADNNPTSAAALYVREVLGPWFSSSITYNNAPAVSEKALDYVYVAKKKENTRFTFDISNLVRKWYSGVNYGVCLDVNTNTWINLYSSDYAYAKPYVQINYVSLAGLESYLSYEEQNMGRAGTGYVSLYNGNLIFAHSDTSSNGNLMPVSTVHYYNSCYHTEDPFGVGPGWKLNLQQSLHKETLANENGGSETYYVYMDEDGTRHHFKYSGGKWQDLSGLGLELTIAGTGATIKDKGDNTLTFDLPTEEFGDNYGHVKMLKTVTDSCGNTMTIHTGSTRQFIYAMDGAGRYTESFRSLYMESLTGPGEGNGVSMEYDDAGHITAFHHGDGQTTRYTYNSQGLLESATDVDGRKVRYTYTMNRADGPYRVSSVEYSNGGVLYGGRRYIYGDCMTTVVDLVANASGTELSEGKRLLYHFNDYGNAVSVNDELGYACFAQYAEELPVNHPATVSSMQKSVVNLLRDHSFESGNGWTLNNMTRATDSSHLGKYALKVSTTGTTTGNHYARQTVTLTPGKTYTLSFYARKSGDIDLWSCFAYRNGAGSLTYAHQPSLKSRLTGEYTRLSQRFTLPADASSPEVQVILYAGAGVGEYFSGWIDSVQLEEGVVANSYNLLENGDFTHNAGSVPLDWLNNSANSAATDIVYASCSGTKPAGLSMNTLRINGGGYGKNKGVYQDLPVSGSAGDVYVAGGWSFGYSKPRKDAAKSYGIRVAFLKSGTSSTRENTPSIEWSEEWTDWQFAAGPVVAPCNYTSIRFNVDYEQNINYAEFGGLFLHKEEFGQTYSYDEKGNVLSTKNLASLRSHGTYDDFNNLLTYRQPGRPSTEQYTLSWGSTTAEKKKHLLQSVTAPLGVVSAYTYDSQGNPLSRQVKNGTGSQVMESSTTYTANGNYVSTQTDARGKTVTRNIDPELGTLTSIQDANGQAVNYQYDDLRRVTGVETTAGGKTYRNGYTYSGDRLTQAGHNTTSDTECDVTYRFAYDGAGRPTTVRVGEQTLSANFYNPDGTVQRVWYGNSTEDNPQELRYTYDAYKRLIGAGYDFHTTDVYEYEYGANGQVVQVRDRLLNRVSTSEYDGANRPMRRTEMAGTSHVYTGEAEYDGYNNLKTFKEQVGSWRTAYRTDFTYDGENRPTQVSYGDSGNKVTYTYDGLGRVGTRTATVGGRSCAAVYGYLPGSNGSGNTTGLVASISQSGENFSYTYDDVGNISSVTRNGVTTSYSYDRLGQLIRVNDPDDMTAGVAGTTWVYEYDRGGNMLSKTAYAYTTVAVGAAVQTLPYSYTDANWKDKLTAYNGVGIPYDEIGNPLFDGEWHYQWEQGRRLWQMYKGTEGQAGNTYVDFGYNAEGLRVSKQVLTYTADGATSYVSTDYTLHGKNIVHMVQGGNSLHFWYDASGRPALVEYNGTKYAYLHNLQGDIVGIVDSTGNEVVKYSYDAWGKPLSKTGSMANTLGTLNPFRYRGYVYDEETGLYYLRSRYYNPVWGRFLNADILIKGNLYTYCLNSPLRMSDGNGMECTLCNKEHYSFTGEIGDKLKHILKKPKNPRMEICQFMEFIKQMVDEKWTYATRDAGIWYGHVDCVGVYRFPMNWYYRDSVYKELGMNSTDVTTLYTNGVYNKDFGAAIGKGRITETTEYTVGMALFRMSKNEEGELHGEHVAIYVGDYFEGYSNAVIEAIAGGVIIRTLEESEAANGAFTHYGYLKGLNYSVK